MITIADLPESILDIALQDGGSERDVQRQQEARRTLRALRNETSNATHEVVKDPESPVMYWPHVSDAGAVSDQYLAGFVNASARCRQVVAEYLSSHRLHLAEPVISEWSPFEAHMQSLDRHNLAVSDPDNWVYADSSVQEAWMLWKEATTSAFDRFLKAVPLPKVIAYAYTTGSNRENFLRPEPFMADRIPASQWKTLKSLVYLDDVTTPWSLGKD